MCVGDSLLHTKCIYNRHAMITIKNVYSSGVGGGGGGSFSDSKSVRNDGGCRNSRAIDFQQRCNIAETDPSDMFIKYDGRKNSSATNGKIACTSTAQKLMPVQ